MEEGNSTRTKRNRITFKMLSNKIYNSTSNKNRNNNMQNINNKKRYNNKIRVESNKKRSNNMNNKKKKEMNRWSNTKTMRENKNIMNRMKNIMNKMKNKMKIKNENILFIYDFMTNKFIKIIKKNYLFIY